MGHRSRSAFGIALVAGCMLAANTQGARREAASTATVQSENFVVSAPDEATAAAVLAQAETLRSELATQWLGEKLPVGIGPTVIRITLSDDEDKGLSWVADRPERLSHMMWLTTSRERATGSTLAHELTHVVLATRFPGQLPAWVDEGIASRQDDAKRKAARREILAWYISTGNWPSLTEVFAAEKIAGSDRSRYTVSASLVDFLLTRGDAAKLLAFATEGKQHGWDAAVRSHFGYTNVRTLEIAWQRWASN